MKHAFPTRRTLLAGLAAQGLLSACAAPGRTPEPLHDAAGPMDVATFHRLRRFVDTPSGRIAYVERGQGPVALFIHGVPLNGLHWRHVIAGVQDGRRCIALDLMGLGYTQIAPGQDVSFTAQARMVREFLDALGIDQVDLVGNDSGGAVSQIFAANHPQRLRTLTLTNCDVHTNWPPPQILPSIEAARQGTLLDRYASMIDNREQRLLRWKSAYGDTSVLTDDVYRAYLEPLMATPQTRAGFHRYWTSFDNAQTVAIEPALRRLRVPTLLAWGTGDIFFHVNWAHWLRDAIPGFTRLVEVPGAMLFFPEDRPQALIGPLRQHWKLA
jgi:pimeloyl-ACP methyl ester carboxylesterase